MDEWIITRKQKGIGILILNRFKALNAINDLFQRQIITILKKWQDDPSIHAVLIKSSQKKLFVQVVIFARLPILHEREIIKKH